MVRISCALLCAVMVACTPSVRVSVPANPAVEVKAHRVAVVAGDRACRAMADALATELRHLEGVEVHPGADVQLEVIACGRQIQPLVDIELEPQAERRRVRLHGRAHAVLEVRVQDQAPSHLIGAAKRVTPVRGPGSLRRAHRVTERLLDGLVATDLVEQVRPVPRDVQRRLYPAIGSGKAGRLFKEAVHAERQGDLHQARRLAEAAHAARPTARSAAYVHELERMIQRQPDVSSSTQPP